MIRKTYGPAMLAALALAAPATQAAAQAQSAYPDAVAACVTIIDTRTAADQTFRPVGLSPQPAHAGLKKFFYEEITDTRWYMRRLNEGVVHAATSDMDRSCSVFLFGVQGSAINRQIGGRFTGWTRQDIEGGGVAYSRRNARGELLVVSIHDGPPTVQPEQIGALVKVYLLSR
jgi:hypothetical protein